MVSEKPPVVILAGIRWNFLWQRHQILATRFARAGYPTVFVETTGLANPRPRRASLRRVLARLRRPGVSGAAGENLTIYSPLVAPPTHRAFRWANRRLLAPRVARALRALCGGSPVVLVHPPTRTTLDLISCLRPRLLVYDCSEDYSGFPDIPRDIEATERELLRRVHLVACTSTTLLERVRALRPDAFLNGPGVDYDLFSTLRDDRAGGEVRTVCYFGHLSRERTDFDALRAIASAGYGVRLVGGLGDVPGGFLDTPGIDYRGEVEHPKLPNALAGVDAFVLPYTINRLTRGIAPAKTYECLATGKPLVSAPLPAMAELGEHVYLASSPEEYVEALRNLRNVETREKVRARMDLARRNSWDARFRALEEAVCQKL